MDLLVILIQVSTKDRRRPTEMVALDVVAVQVGGVCYGVLIGWV